MSSFADPGRSACARGCGNPAALYRVVDADEMLLGAGEGRDCCGRKPPALELVLLTFDASGASATFDTGSIYSYYRPNINGTSHGWATKVCFALRRVMRSSKRHVIRRAKAIFPAVNVMAAVRNRLLNILMWGSGVSKRTPGQVELFGPCILCAARAGDPKFRTNVAANLAGRQGQ